VRLAQCPTCGTQRPFQRALGWGTFFACVVTFGFWIFAIPFYPLRCRSCGTERVTSRKSGRLSKMSPFRQLAIVAAVYLLIVLIVVLIVFLLR
jgi:hypothetical protein